MSVTLGGALNVVIWGSPIGGENPPHDRLWREQVAYALEPFAPTSAVALHFLMESRRRVDLDNLVRPAMAGLQDAGIFARGFPDLELLVATKSPAAQPGLIVETDPLVTAAQAADPNMPLLQVSSDRPPREGDRHSKVVWRDEVATALTGDVLAAPVWVAITIAAPHSLVSFMKPVIDGLEPALGRDPRGRLEFTPNDHLIDRLVVRRDRTASRGILLALGLLP